MHLCITVPGATLLDADVDRLVAEATSGWFCLLPHHLDVVAALVPGILLATDPAGHERAAAIDDGILVKCGRDVLVASPRGVVGPELGQLRDTVQRVFLSVDEREHAARAAMRKLEVSFLRQLLDLEEAGHG
jgi:F-type H+-transporting ATPase subunit epsilon